MVATANCPSDLCHPAEVQASSAAGEMRKDLRDELIYDWVRFEGKSQQWVAIEMGLSQGTVSRIIQRVERRQAHTAQRLDGRLDPQELLRVQRRLTYERNERILSSCLRFAHDMQFLRDMSKSVINRGAHLTEEREMRTEHFVQDRSGTAARYLRLAFRINMEQLKLVEMEPLAPLPPLTAEELAELDRDDVPSDEQAPTEFAVKLAELPTEGELTTSETVEESPAECCDEANTDECPSAIDDHAAGNYAHSAHRRIPQEVDVSAEAACSCDATCRPEKSADIERIANGEAEPGKEPHERQRRVGLGEMPRDDDARCKIDAQANEHRGNSGRDEDNLDTPRPLSRIQYETISGCGTTTCDCAR